MAPICPSQSIGHRLAWLSPLILFASATACAAPAAIQIKTPVATAKNEHSIPELQGGSGAEAKVENTRKVGDVWVHRFSGTYRGAPVILREEVVGIAANLLTVRYRLEDGDSVTELEVSMTQGNEQVLEVALLKNGKSAPGSIQDLNDLMAKTVFVPDQNSGRVAQKNETCLVGKAELDCEITQYKIFVGDDEALLSVSRNNDMKRDIGGEITAVDGTVLYHAELIEMQRGEHVLSKDSSVALIDPKID